MFCYFQDIDMTLEGLIALLRDSPMFQMKNPGLTAHVEGRNRTLYMPTVTSIEERTRPNLAKKLTEVGLLDGHEVMVADVTTPNTVVIKLRFSQDVEMV